MVTSLYRLSLLINTIHNQSFTCTLCFLFNFVSEISTMSGVSLFIMVSILYLFWFEIIGLAFIEIIFKCFTFN